MYRATQLPQEPSRLARLSLAKFSHTTTSVNHSGPLNWSHIIGNGDLIGVLENHPPAYASTPARALLKVFRDNEKLEEIDLTYHTREAASLVLLGQNSQTKPIFAVIVKLPCLAVKYPTGTSHIRRFQIKFSTDRDYYATLAILSTINCPFSESNIGSLQPARRPTSTQWRSGSVSSIPTVPDMFPSGSSAAGPPGLSNVIFPSHPSSTTDSSGISSNAIGSLLRPSSSSTTHTVTDFLPINNSQGPDLSMRPPHATSQLESDTMEQVNTVLTSSRPSTAYHDAQTLDQILPPKRDLPFSKPAAKKPRTTKKSISKAFVGQNSIERATDEQSQFQPQPQLPTQASPDSKPNKPSYRATKATDNIKRPKCSLTSLPQLNTGQEDPINLPPSQQQHTQGNANISIQPAVHPTIIQQQQQQPTSNNIHPVTQQTSNDISNGALNTIINGHKNNTTKQQEQSNITTDLSSYVSTPTIERITRLENWMCEHIQDDDFLRLCQDVEAVWKRVAFGG